MLWSRARRRRLGVTLIEVLAVSGLIAGLHGQGNYGYAVSRANELKGLNNLRQIYLLLKMQCLTDKLPDAAFYPKGDPAKDPRSILKLVPGAPAKLFVSPFAPAGLKKKGLTFAWNDAVNGKQLDNLPRKTWLLIDLAAFIADPNVPKPRAYLVLYADGSTKALKAVPAEIAKLVEAAKKKKGT